jgi:hypothetical protein
MDELKRIKDVVENFKNKHPEKCIKTCILVWEDCMPSCPFKREHDDLQIYLKKINYWDSHLGALTCKKWTDNEGASILPRAGTNCYWSSLSTFNEYAELVDIFKHSGRLSVMVPQGSGNLQFGWLCDERAAVGSFGEVIGNKLEPIHSWILGTGFFPSLITDVKEIVEYQSGNMWMTDEGKKLTQRLKNCMNNCYHCHLCERTFGLPDIDSMIEL